MNRRVRRRLYRFRFLAACCAAALAVAQPWPAAGEGPAGAERPFRAGAFAQDITPDWFPIVVNGGFQPHYAQKANDPLHARCLVLDDGQTQLAVVVVDSCVLDRPLMDQAKAAAEKLTGIPAGRIFMSATHCHSAPAAVGALGTDPDERYCQFLPGRIAEGIQRAQKNLAPAQIGWAVGSLPGVPHARRWIARPDRIKEDPFGEQTVRATMHPGYRNPDWESPADPMHPDVPVIAVRSPDGRPVALLANFAIHYVGAPALSADYFGVFARRIGELIGAVPGEPAFVGMISNGASGEAYLRDYSRKEPEKFDMQSIGEMVAQEAARAYKTIRWHDRLPLAACEEELELAVRPPRVEWGKKIMDEIEKEKRPLKSLTDFYAREQLLLAQMPPTRKLRLKVVRIGGLAMAGIPCEVYGLTGWRVRKASPFDYTFTVMLANGWDGYLPPPEHMLMGGYTTWLARSSCLEPQAEPKIRAVLAKLLQQAAGGYRAQEKAPPSPYAAAVLQSKPLVYFRMDDLEGPGALDAASAKPLGQFPDQIAWFLEGPQPPEFPGLEAANRAPHFVGQGFSARVPGLGPAYTVEMWFSNYMPTDARAVTGYLFSRGAAGAEGESGDHLAIGGTETAPGKLVFHAGAGLKEALAGPTELPLRHWEARENWRHVAMVRDGDGVKVYLDGKAQPEIDGRAPPAQGEQITVGGGPSPGSGFEGRIDEVAVFGRALTAEEVQKHYQAAMGK